MTDLRVKICGITNLEDARAAVDAGADLLGFIFFAKSPRYIEPAHADEIVAAIQESVIRGQLSVISDQRVPNSSISNIQSPISTPQSPISTPHFVGVFVNEEIARVAEILNDTGINYAQLHGEESPATLERLAPRAFKALRPSSHEEAITEADIYGALGVPDGPQLLIDAYDPAAYGGTGKKADWQAAAAVRQRYPRLMLAGGLTPDNVAQAIAIVHPWAVDVSSGVESAPGRKDHAALRAFIQRAKGTNHRSQPDN